MFASITTPLIASSMESNILVFVSFNISFALSDSVPINLARLMGTESDKAKEMLKDTKTKMFDSIEEAINGVVMEANK